MTRDISKVEDLRKNLTFFFVGSSLLKIFCLILAEFGVQKKLRRAVEGC